MKNGLSYLKLDDVVDYLSGKLVFLRVDTNTTLTDGYFEPSERIASAGETIKFLTNHGARVIVATHNGRNGNPDYVSVAPLTHLFRSAFIPIRSIGNSYNDDNLNDDAINAIKTLKNGRALLLENLRFLPGEEGEGAEPARYSETPFIRTLLDDCGVVYMVNDGFSISHRVCRSLLGFSEIPNFAGLTMDRELSSLGAVREHFSDASSTNVYILGGKKVQEYFSLMENSLKEGIVTHILTGGLLANLIFYVQGVGIGEASLKLLKKGDNKGKSILDYAQRMKTLLDNHGDVFEVPTDVAYGVRRGLRHECTVVEISEKLGTEDAILDIGTETIEKYTNILNSANLVYIKGPVGAFEDAEFNRGSSRLLNCVRNDRVYTVMGGGDTTGMLDRFDIPSTEVNYISLAGGALLLALAGESLPGLEALQQSYDKFHTQFTKSNKPTI